MCELFINIVGTILGGILLTLILFFSNEYLFKTINLSSEWIAVITHKAPVDNLWLELWAEFQIHLIQKGFEISGSGEKTRYSNRDGSIAIHEKSSRILIRIDGYYDKKYLGKSVIYLNIVEDGPLRESRTTFILKFESKSKLTGYFISTVSDATGEVTLMKTPTYFKI